MDSTRVSPSRGSTFTPITAEQVVTAYATADRLPYRFDTSVITWLGRQHGIDQHQYRFGFMRGWTNRPIGQFADDLRIVAGYADGQAAWDAAAAQYRTAVSS